MYMPRYDLSACNITCDESTDQKSGHLFIDNLQYLSLFSGGQTMDPV